MERKIYFDTSWTFKEAVKNIRALRLKYDEVLASFSIFEQKEKVEFIRSTRDLFYSLKLKEWEKDKLWCYMNKDEQLYVLIGITRRSK